MISLIFNILTLVVVVLLGVYIFKRYFFTKLSSQLNKEISQKNELIKEQNDLVVARHELEKSTNEQEEKCANLYLKVDQWKTTVENNHEEKLTNYGKNLEKLKEKLTVQSNNYSNDKIRQAITSDVIESLREDLEDYFDKEKNARKFFGYIMSNMNRRKFQD